MHLLGSLAFHVGSAQKLLELFQGDLAAMNPHDGVDVLVVSAFPNDYTPTATSLIGALHGAGVSVGDLATRPRYDLREYWASWLSEDVQGQGFRRILCYEPAHRAADEHGVDAIFRALAPFVGMKNGARRIALPVVGTGDRGRPIAEVLPPLLQSAYEALGNTALSNIRLVVRDQSRVDETRELFRVFKDTHLGDLGEHGPLETQYDVFLSYSQKWAEDAEVMHEELLRLDRDIRIFQDLRRLRTGQDYRPQLDLAIRSSARVVPLYTPEYFASDACKDEFNTAWALRGSGAPDLLFPLLVREQGRDGNTVGSALDGDARKTTTQYQRCVEADRNRMQAACVQLVRELGRTGASTTSMSATTG
jgi:hypothetical protein